MSKLRFSPVVYIKEYLKELNVGSQWLSNKSGIPIDIVAKLLLDKIPINDDIARGLERATGISDRTWVNLQKKYDNKD